MKMDGATAIIKTLESNGVEYIFGYSGGAVIPLFDALVTSKTKIKLILVRHEQGALHMADGYARSSGKPGVVLVTSGPGAGNAVTGLMTAHMDSVPLVVISGQQIRSMLGFDAFQEADIFNITMPVTKHNYLVKEINDLPRVINEAFHLASTGRPGPVLVDVPKDVSSGLFTGNFDGKISLPAYKHKLTLPTDDLNEIMNAWKLAKKPLILAGHGVILSGASKKLKRLIEIMDTPVTTTLLGKGAVDENSKYSLGMLGMHGTAYANKAMTECDFLLNIGSRFDDRIIGKIDDFCKQAKIAHIDIDKSEIGKMIKPDYYAQSDALSAIEYLTSLTKKQHLDSWNKHLAGYKIKYPLKFATKQKLSMQAVINAVYKVTKGDAIVSTDVGQHQMWAAQFYKVKNEKQWLSSGGAGTMGFGMPAAIGAQFANPDKRVVAFVGDGGFQMTQYELATACINKLPIKIVILNNHYLGMVRQWQELFYENRESGVDLEGNPDFVMLAKSYGAEGVSIDKHSDLLEKLEWAMSINDKPVVINAEVIKTDKVFPMVPPGSSLADMIIEPPSKDKILDKPTGST